MKHIYMTLIACTLLVLTGCNRVNEEDSNFENVVYVENAKNTNTEQLTLETTTQALEKVIQAALALPTDHDVYIRFKADTTLVDFYNKTSAATTEPLPGDLFELSATDAVITAGNVLSSEITVRFKDLNTLPRNRMFLLPVTIEAADGVAILNGARTIYYVLRKGAAINVVPDLTANYIDLPSLQNSTVLDNLTQFTMEGLLRPAELPDRPKTFMGIEGYCLLRIGDVSPLLPNQLQLAGPSNYNTGLYMTAKKWHHVAVTFDVPARTIIVYLDGEEVSRTTSAPSYTGNVVSLGQGCTNSNDFYIGRSYDNARYFPGYMSELRIWNIIRTQEEIKANMYGVLPDTPGLMAYWKMNEGSGRNIRDHSGHGLDGVANENLVWIPVELPATD
ncbi:MAG: DUF1735 and LamG domain-containing protein [Prevotellaceae bacterium]|nr:DUF1735 and LamG domain-containing protein [Prevotellaceae bacterium]